MMSWWWTTQWRVETAIKFHKLYLSTNSQLCISTCVVSCSDSQHHQWCSGTWNPRTISDSVMWRARWTTPNLKLGLPEWSQHGQWLREEPVQQRNRDAGGWRVRERRRGDLHLHGQQSIWPCNRSYRSVYCRWVLLTSNWHDRMRWLSGGGFRISCSSLF